jgi:integrase/recombinase XerD
MESVSPSTMQREGGILRVFFNFCLRKKWLSENPMVGLSKLRHTPTPRTLWTESQIRLMHKSLPDWGKDIFAFIALTGVRPVEACKLRFCDVKGQAVRVHCWKNQKDGSRWIGLSDEAHAIISRRMESMKDHDDPIFTNHEGKRLLPDHLNKTFTRTREKLGFPEALQLYALRHTFASRLCENNVNLKIVQDLLGHSQIRTTERYLQIRTEKLTEAANKIRGIFTQ